MKTIQCLIGLTIFASNALFAQAVDYGEQVIVAHQQNRTAIEPGPDLVEACGELEWLLGTDVVAGARSDLYSVQSKKTDGSLLKDDLKKIGTFLGCQGPLTEEIERFLFPTGDAGLVGYLTLNGEDYIMTGSTRLRTNPFLGGFPGPGMFLSGSTGTIQEPFTIADFPFNIRTVGAVTGVTISTPTGINVFDSSSIFTIRLYSPTGGDAPVE